MQYGIVRLFNHEPNSPGRYKLIFEFTYYPKSLLVCKVKAESAKNIERSFLTKDLIEALAKALNNPDTVIINQDDPTNLRDIKKLCNLKFYSLKNPYVPEQLDTIFNNHGCKIECIGANDSNNFIDDSP